MKFVTFLHNIILMPIYFFLIQGGGKGAPYYVGAAQTLPRGMYSDRNKNVVGKWNSIKFAVLKLITVNICLTV